MKSESLISLLFDPKNRSPIELDGSDGKHYIFLQIFATRLNDLAYCIVRPLAEIQGFSQNSALVLCVGSDDRVNVIKEKALCDSIFNRYYRMISGAEKDANSIVKSSGIYINPFSNQSTNFTMTKLKSDFDPLLKLDVAFRKIVGQDFACQAVKEYLFSVLHRTNKKGVAGCLLFAGAPASGKTLMAESIAEALHRPFLRLDMSEYGHKESFLDLCGLNKSYREASAGILTSFVSDNPVSVVLLDEIEKAHPNSLKIFLQVFERGALMDAFSRETVQFHDTIFIITTNFGKSIYDQSMTNYNFSGVPQSKIVRALQKETDPSTGEVVFSDALISRFTSGRIILFNRLRPEILHRIVTSEIQAQKRYYTNRYKISFLLDESELAKMLIFSSGEKADIRGLIKSAREFFEKIMERMTEIGKEHSSSFCFERIFWSVDQKSFSPEIKRIFDGEIRHRILVDADESVRSMLRGFSSEKTEWIEVSDDFDINMISSLDLSAAIIQIDEDEEKKRELFLNAVREETFPCYVFSRKDLSRSGFFFYTDHGATDCYSEKIVSMPFKDWLRDIVRGTDLSFITQSLFKANQEIHYEINYFPDVVKREFRVEFDRMQIVTSISGDEENHFLNGRNIPRVTFDDIEGAKEAKEELKRVLAYLKNPKYYQRLGWKLPRGILLDGEPGTGKTMLAKALANAAQLPFIQRNSSEFLNKYVGEGAKLMRETFAVARKYAPCIIFIDEIDLIAKSRETAGDRNEYVSEIVNTFLSEMDGFVDYNQPVFVIAATNFSTEKGKTKLDEAFLRRFDKKIHVELPNVSEREHFLTRKLSEYRLTSISKEGIRNIARRSIGWNLADLSLVVQNILRKNGEENYQAIGDRDLNEAFESFSDGAVKKQSKYQMNKSAYHEAGHALMACLLGKTPEYVTILSRRNYGGYVLVGDEDQCEYTRDDYLDRICVALAGRAAEFLIYQKKGVSTGARSDLQTATSLALEMVLSNGMEDDLISYESVEDPLSKPFIREKVDRILKEQYQKTLKALEDHRLLLEEIARKLLKKNYLNPADLKKILRKEKENETRSNQN